jgi:hypothetical protein
VAKRNHKFESPPTKQVSNIGKLAGILETAMSTVKVQATAMKDQAAAAKDNAAAAKDNATAAKGQAESSQIVATTIQNMWMHQQQQQQLLLQNQNKPGSPDAQDALAVINPPHAKDSSSDDDARTALVFSSPTKTGAALVLPEHERANGWRVRITSHADKNVEGRVKYRKGPNGKKSYFVQPDDWNIPAIGPKTNCSLMPLSRPN